MLFTKLRIKNLYSFQDSVLDFTFPKKPVNSTILCEHPKDRPNINVKRFCIFTGGNASGKTAIGKILCGVQNLIARGNSIDWIHAGICDAGRQAEVHAEVISTHNNWIHSFVFKFNKSAELIEGMPVEIEYAGVYITKTDYISSARKKLAAIFENKKAGTNESYLHSNNFISFREQLTEEAKSFETAGWYYQLSQNTNSSISGFDNVIKGDILKKVLTTFDASILNVEKIISSEKGTSLGYRIEFKNSDSVIIENDGDISKNKSDRLSRGTYEAIKVAFFLSRIVEDSSLDGGGATYFMDEAMAYAHSDLERSTVNIILDKLGENSQFFYTTHNIDILDLNVPVHSHYFIRKDENGSQVLSAEKLLKKNDRPLKNILNSDVFGILPDTSTLEEMLWE